jgi:5-methylcytosine-specific restriction endonuclease McrA
MPCDPRTARLLLKDGVAKVIKRDPFTIKLLVGVKGYTQPLTLGIDPGSKFIGSAVRDSKNRALYLSQVEQRTDIKSKMDQRRSYRRTRRNRKTRYRKPRFLNRQASTKEDRYPPTLESKFGAIFREINFVYNLLPISDLYIEMAKFDIQALTNPNVLNYHWLYQRGPKYQFYNTKAYILSRDNYTCQYCKNKRKDTHLQVHHIQAQSNGGSNQPNNLITLCSTCHDDLHKKRISLSTKHLRAVKNNLKHASQMNVLCSMIQKRFGIGVFQKTFGGVAKGVREYFKYPKEHYWDAFFGSFETGDDPVIVTDRVIMKKCVAKGEYQKTKGKRSEKRMPSDKIQGFKRWDKVLYQDTVCFIKGRMSTGYAILCDIFGTKIDFKPIPKFTSMQRISSRKSWIMTS